MLRKAMMMHNKAGSSRAWFCWQDIQCELHSGHTACDKEAGSPEGRKATASIGLPWSMEATLCIQRQVLSFDC